MLSLKSLIPAAILATSLPLTASATAFDGVFPLLSAVMTPHHPARLMQADYRRFPVLGPVIVDRPSLPHLSLQLHCAVAGTPVEFPDDLHIWSDHAIAAGTVASWSVTGTNLQGSVVLPALAAGQYYFASHVLPGGMEAGHPCTAQTN